MITHVVAFFLIIQLNNNDKPVLVKFDNGYCDVLATKLNVREKPDLNSKILTQKNFASGVKILKRSGKFEVINGVKSEWVYIDSERFDESGNDTIKGWVVDYYLSDLSEFKPITSFGDYYIEAILTEFYVRMNFYPDGTFTAIQYDRETQTESEIKGQLYQFRNVIIADKEGHRIDGSGYRLAFYIDEKGNIISEFNKPLIKGHKKFKLNEPPSPDLPLPDERPKLK